jgi:uncharacterized protein YegL
MQEVFQNALTAAKAIQLTIGDVLWPKNYKKIRNKKATQWKPVTNITTNNTPLQHKENPNNVHTDKASYASVAASDLNQQKSHTLETADINRTLQLILNEITSLEGVYSKMSERVKKLESDTTKPATNSKHK